MTPKDIGVNSMIGSRLFSLNIRHNYRTLYPKFLTWFVFNEEGIPDLAVEVESLPQL
jgi:hypothetical protein